MRENRGDFGGIYMGKIRGGKLLLVVKRTWGKKNTCSLRVLHEQRKRWKRYTFLP